jgi:hypothetical protein
MTIPHLPESTPHRKPAFPPHGPSTLTVATETATERRRRRLGDPSLHEAVLKVLSRARIAKEERQGLLSETICRALACALVPDEDVLCRQFVCGMARNVAREYRRDRMRRREQLSFEESASEAPRVESRIDERLTILGIVDDAEPGDRRAYTWWARTILFGHTCAEIAGEEGIGYSTVCRTVERARQRLERGVHTSAVFAIMIVFLYGVLRNQRPRQDVADHDKLPKTEEPAPAPKPESKVNTPAPSRGETEEIRSKALADCAEGSWQACYDGLEAARRLDPAGDATPEIERARAEAMAELEAKAPHKAAPRHASPQPRPHTGDK